MTSTASDTHLAGGRRRYRRLVLIGVAGVLLLAGALFFRNTPWARERELSRLPSGTLALMALERPNDPLVFRYLGDALSREGDAAGTLHAYERAVTLNPKDADAQLGLGLALAASDQPYAAERCWVKAAELRPKDPRPHMMLANLYGYYRNTTSTIAPLEKVTELDPKNADAWHRLGGALEDLHQFDRALPDYQKAAALAPDRAPYHRDLAQLQLYMGQRDQARASLGRARSLDPSDPGTLVLLAKMDLDAGTAPDRLDGAEQLLLQALKLDAHFAPALRELGDIYTRRKELAKAETTLRKAVKYDPTDGEALFQLSQVLLRTGHSAEGKRLLKGFQELTEARRSVSSLEDRIHQDPKNPDLRLRVARLYRQYGAPERAVNQYQVYLSLKPSDQTVARELLAYRKTLLKANGGGGRTQSGAQAVRAGQ